jgi:hypothetical protein
LTPVYQGGSVLILNPADKLKEICTEEKQPGALFHLGTSLREFSIPKVFRIPKSLTSPHAHQQSRPQAVLPLNTKGSRLNTDHSGVIKPLLNHHLQLGPVFDIIYSVNDVTNKNKLLISRD